jgi:hypothetical protein
MQLPAFATRRLATAQLYGKQHGPTILTVSGTIGFATTAILTGIAAVRSQGVVADMKKRGQVINERANFEGWTEQDRVKAVVHETIPGVKELVKIYAPPVILGVLSGAAIMAGHGLMLKQRAGLIAAYGALDASFRAYRKRVGEEYGEEVERKLYADRFVMRDEDRDDQGLPCTIDDMDPGFPSLYSKYFDEYSFNYNKNPEYNRTFLTQQQNYANNRLQSRGYLFLSDVYRSLGFEETQASRAVGWTLNGPGDHYVDFGLHRIGDPNTRAFVNNLESVVLLDFNVDGVITVPDRRK